MALLGTLWLAVLICLLSQAIDLEDDPTNHRRRFDLVPARFPTAVV